jgi:hypothetical protein
MCLFATNFAYFQFLADSGIMTYSSSLKKEFGGPVFLTKSSFNVRKHSLEKLQIKGRTARYTNRLSYNERIGGVTESM